MNPTDVSPWSFRFINDIGIELYLHRSAHDNTYPLFDREGSSSLTELGLNCKFTFLKGKVFRPFFGIGMSLAWLKVENCSFSPASPQKAGDATFTGAGGDLLSIGLDVFLSQKLFPLFTASYSSFGFWSVKGMSGTSYEVEFENKTLNVNYPKVAVGIAYTLFQKEK